jgi:DNA-binding HxlR family transcriptional regulator
VKRYAQRCPVARALDVIGERWSLLIARELMLGPRRYTDLLDGLPGIPTNVLAARLKDLHAAGLLTKRALPPPTVVTVYELTEAGQALGPTLDALRRWGRHYGPPMSETDSTRPAWVLLSASSRPTTAPVGRVCQLRVGSEYFQLTVDHIGLSVHGGLAEKPDAVVTLDCETLYLLMAGHATITHPRITIDGDHNTAREFLNSLHGALAADPT